MTSSLRVTSSLRLTSSAPPLDTLFEGLTDPDPAVRDETAYPEFASAVRSGELDSSLVEIGDRLAAMLSDNAIQTRTFATLVLSWAVRRASFLGSFDDAIERWRSAFTSWWSSEEDLRGYDHKLGWLHAVAHGADTVRAFALVPSAADAQLQALLSLTAARLLTPTDYLFGHAEDERVAYALAIVLSRPALVDPVSWLAPVAAAFAAGEPGPVPAFAANTLRTLNSLYVAVHRGVVWYDVETQEASAPQISARRDQILEEIASVIRDPSRWLG